MCIFCKLEDSRIVAENEHAIVVKDGYPVTEAHSLVIPKRHTASIFDLSAEEQSGVWELLKKQKSDLLSSDSTIVAFNIGVNDGAAAGQTISHTHVHLIPRRVGDVADPRGGVRGVIAEKQKYSVQGSIPKQV